MLFYQTVLIDIWFTSAFTGHSYLKAYSIYQVESIARDSFFFLEESFPFDESSFGELFDVVTVRRPLLVSKPVSYVFKLHPPTDIEYGNYRTLLRQHLYI